jgi:GTP cyclohydrolase I
LITQLPDVAHTQLAKQQARLNWVGMDDIRLPVNLDEAAGVTQCQATASIAVDLPGGENAAKGIHMSRLYLLLNELATGLLLTSRLKHCLEQVLASHQDLASSSARIELAFDFLLQRPALISHSPAGWRTYPVSLCAELSPQTGFTLALQLELQYSSTCPCSAALVRDTLADTFKQAFQSQDTVSKTQVSDWLKQHGTLATPHSQRSLALVSLPLNTNLETLGLVQLIETLESVIATPVQTSVKRTDELAFAKLNGNNLMFVEDISRKLSEHLEHKHPGAAIQVRHLESLHAHNAFAQTFNQATKAHLGTQFKQEIR